MKTKARPEIKFRICMQGFIQVVSKKFVTTRSNGGMTYDVTEYFWRKLV